MKVLITGGSGFIGRGLSSYLKSKGHEVRWVSRKPAPGDCGWGPESLLEGVSWADGVVNLAGHLVLGIWTASKRRRILDSRVKSTRLLVQAILQAKSKSKVLVSGSAIGFYGDGGDRALDESSPAAGAGDFLSEVCQAWEAEAMKAGQAGVRTCLIRTGHVLHPSGGVLKAMLLPFKLGLGGPMGNGRQWTSWIHLEDWCGLCLHLLLTPSLEGPFNAVGPEPLTNRDYSKQIAKTLGKPCIFTVPSFLLRMLGQVSQLFLDSQKILPKRALDTGFSFKFPSLPDALQDLLAS